MQVLQLFSDINRVIDLLARRPVDKGNDMIYAPSATNLFCQETLITSSIRAHGPSSSLRPRPPNCISPYNWKVLHHPHREGSAWYIPGLLLPLPCSRCCLGSLKKRFPVGTSPISSSATQSCRESGGSWTANQTMAAVKVPPKLLTLLIVHKLGRVLLGRKKRG